MDQHSYRQMAAAETEHWWFKGRRAVVGKMLDGLGLPAGARILEAGCGTGGNLAFLSGYGAVTGIEPDAYALSTARKRKVGDIREGSLPGPNGLKPSEKFDLIVMLDVLEHLEHPVESLKALRSHLRKGGKLLVTVPANPWLWSAHDTHHHHYRRYTARSLRTHAIKGGFKVSFLSPYNMFLLPLAAAGRLVDRLRGNKTPAGLGIPPRPVNALLAATMSSERFLLPTVRLPAGVSLIMVADAA